MPRQTTPFANESVGNPTSHTPPHRRLCHSQSQLAPKLLQRGELPLRVSNLRVQRTRLCFRGRRIDIAERLATEEAQHLQLVRAGVVTVI